MPFKSEKQRRYLWATQPEIAKRWAKEYPESNKNLPTYADEKVKSKKLNKSEAKEAHMTTPETILGPLLARFALPRHPIQKRANSILERVEIPQNGQPTYANQGPVQHEDTGPNPVDNDDGQVEDPAPNNPALCSKIAKEKKAEELQQITQILRKKAMVPAKQFREIIDRMLAGANMGIQQAQEPKNVAGNIAGQYGNGAGVGSGLGGGGVGQGTQAQGQSGTGQGRNLGPAPPQGSPTPNNVGNSYLAFLRSSASQASQARANAMIPPPIGSQGSPAPPAVVASFPGMNSAPTKTASNIAGSSLGKALHGIQPLSPDFQASNLANKHKNKFSSGNDALLNTIGKLSPFKTEQGKVDLTAGLSGGAYGNLPNTPKTTQLG